MLVNGEELRSSKDVYVNVSSESKRETFNVNVAKKVEHLVEKFKNEGYDDAGNCYFFFKKCFETLSEDMIWSIYETAMHKPGIDSRIKYFIGACRNQLEFKAKKSA